MKRSDFNIITEIVIQFYNDLKKIDDSSFNGEVLKLRMSRFNLAYYYYESFRKDIRKLYMSKESKPMDRHKIAATIMCALLKSKVIRVKRTISNLPLILLMANEYIAFCCALNIVDLYIRDYTNNDYSLIIPTTYIDDEQQNISYLENTCKALYYTKRFQISDIFSYANILFLLEKYTDTIKPDLKPKENFNETNEN